MFNYDSADITYAVTFGKGDGSSNIDYSVDLNKKEACNYTKARMLGQDLEEVLDTNRIEREIIRYERDEYDSDISYASVSIWFCDNQEQPPVEDVKNYLKDLLAAHRISSAREVVEAQINVFEDRENDWNQIALDLAMEVNCPGYAKRYQEGKFNKQIWDKEREELILKRQQEREAKEKEEEERQKKLKEEYNPWIDPSWKSHKLLEEEKIKRCRGCKNITKPTDTQLHLITKSGKEIVLEAIPPFELSFYGIGLCPYRVKKWNEDDERPLVHDCRVPIGVWGFIDTEGNVVVEPQYTSVNGPYGSNESEYYVVTKLVLKKSLVTSKYVYYSGILDSEGNELVPCQYDKIKPTMYGNKVHDILVYGLENNHYCIRYGLMNIDGTVILKPSFNYISCENFNLDNKLFLAGSSNFDFGVFSLEKNKFITPDTCSYVKFNDEAKTIECSYSVNMFGWYSHKKGIFDYNGNLISSEVIN